MLEEYVTNASCCAGCSAINLASGPASGSYATRVSTPGSGASALTTVGQTFTTGGECVILSSFTLELRPQNTINNPVSITALLYTFDLSNNLVIGPRLASQSISAVQSQSSLPVTFPQPVQLSPATSYAIILTTSGLGQGSTAYSINVQRSDYGNPNEILDGKFITQNSGDNPGAIETNPFFQSFENLAITVN